MMTHMCMSLDGFVAQPDDNPAELFDWYWSGDVVVPSGHEGMSFSVDAASAPMLQERRGSRRAAPRTRPATCTCESSPWPRLYDGTDTSDSSLDERFTGEPLVRRNDVSR